MFISNINDPRIHPWWTNAWTGEGLENAHRSPPEGIFLEVIFEQMQQGTLDTLCAKLCDEPYLPDLIDGSSNIHGSNQRSQARVQSILPILGEKEEDSSGPGRSKAKLGV